MGTWTMTVGVEVRSGVKICRVALQLLDIGCNEEEGSKVIFSLSKISFNGR